MSRRTEVPPVVAAVVIAVLVAIAAFAIWKYTGRSGHPTGMTADMAQKMKEGMAHSQMAPRRLTGLR